MNDQRMSTPSTMTVNIDGGGGAYEEMNELESVGQPVLIGYLPIMEEDHDLTESLVGHQNLQLFIPSTLLTENLDGHDGVMSQEMGGDTQRQNHQISSENMSKFIGSEGSTVVGLTLTSNDTDLVLEHGEWGNSPKWVILHRAPGPQHKLYRYVPKFPPVSPGKNHHPNIGEKKIYY